MKEWGNFEKLRYLVDLESVSTSVELSLIYNSTGLWARLQQSRPETFSFQTFGVEYRCRRILNNEQLADRIEIFSGEDGLIEARYAISPNIIKPSNIGMLVTPPERNFEALQASIRSLTKRFPTRALTLTSEEINVLGLVTLNPVEEVIVDPMSISIGRFSEEMYYKWVDYSNKYSAYYELYRRETVNKKDGLSVLTPSTALYRG